MQHKAGACHVHSMRRTNVYYLKYCYTSYNFNWKELFDFNQSDPDTSGQSKLKHATPFPINHELLLIQTLIGSFNF